METKVTTDLCCNLIQSSPSPYWAKNEELLRSLATEQQGSYKETAVGQSLKLAFFKTN